MITEIELKEPMAFEEWLDKYKPIENHLVDNPSFRSEERRVGKECRSRWSPYH